MLGMIALALVCAQHPQLKSDVVIYTPDKELKEQSFTLKNWGGGSFTESPWVVLYGKYSLRLASATYFQGGAIEFKNPLDTTDALSHPDKQLRISFFLENPGPVRSKQYADVTIVGKKRLSYDRPQGAPTAIYEVTRLRMILTTTDGLKSELYYPLNIAKTSTSHGWRTASVPFNAFIGINKTNKQVKEMKLSMSSKGIIYLGDIDIAEDGTPITADVTPAYAKVKVGSVVKFSATGDAGVTAVKYLWDFDASDGIQPDTEASVVQHKFTKVGKQTVTMIAEDRFGVKPPVRKSITIVVTA